MKPRFDDKPGLVKLANRSKGDLQVLLNEFTLTKLDEGLRLEVAVTGDLYSIIDRAGKREFFSAIEEAGGNEREKMARSLAQFYRDKKLVAYRFDCSNSPFRYANGGVLPVVRLDSTDYFCLFYRDIYPIGWNIANGGSDTLEELLDPQRIIFREFGEELIISDHQKCLLYAYEPGAEDTFYGLQNEGLEAWKIRFKNLGLDQYKKLSLPVKWIEGPDWVSATVGRRRHTSRGYFLNINPEDNGIEVDRIALINLKDNINIYDGEITRGVLCNRMVGLFQVDSLRRELKNGKLRRSDFRPQRLFFEGQEEKPERLEELTRLETLPAQAGLRTEEEKRRFRDEPKKFDLCPVTRNLAQRYMMWEKEEGGELLALSASQHRAEIARAATSEVFITFNSADLMEARGLYDYLTARGHKVFFSAVSLAMLGESDYCAAIDRALEAATCLIVFGTRPEHLDSGWVGYEWRSFLAEIHSARKPRGKIFNMVSEMKVEDLPYGLRSVQMIRYAPLSPRESFEKLYNFIRHSLYQAQAVR
ncbi:MAG: TIR domain-containing protein [Acidobacteriota bacterium]